ncbi:MAG TPA: glycosyltransferase [Pyrinomonadaceae bacterium]|nr:glycosyltransferase [Pyrinomonadaceae bacterium]
MKVVRIIARLNVGGPARHVVWLTAGLRERCETLLVAGRVPMGEDDMSYFASENAVEPLIIPQMSREISPKDLWTIWKLYRLFVHVRPDLVHTHTAKAGTVGRVAGLLYRWLTPMTLLARPRRCCFVHTYHGHIFHSYYGRLKTRIFLWIERTLARTGTDRIVVISPQQYREIHEEFHVGRARQFAVIPLGLDTNVFAEWSNHRHVMRDELEASDSDILVGIVGRLTEIKNHSLFLASAARYKERFGTVRMGRRVRFIILGDGNLRERLEGQARELGLDADVEFMGTRNDPENFYPALDIVALTSLNEGTPLTLIEAMANARAVIATAVGGVVDLLGAEVDSSKGSKTDAYALCERGVRVRANDAEGFSEGLARLIEDEELRRALGERGRAFVERNYSKERLLTDVMNLYDDLTRGESRKSIESIESVESCKSG